MIHFNIICAFLHYLDYLNYDLNFLIINSSLSFLSLQLRITQLIYGLFSSAMTPEQGMELVARQFSSVKEIPEKYYWILMMDMVLPFVRFLFLKICRAKALCPLLILLKLILMKKKITLKLPFPLQFVTTGVLIHLR